jgi:hypothetical protein
MIDDKCFFCGYSRGVGAHALSEAGEILGILESIDGDGTETWDYFDEAVELRE